MIDLDLWLVDSFTDTPLTGNPAGVVLDPGELDEDTCCRIAAELGTSESVFVYPGVAAGADHRVRFFTPVREVDLCGHATVAAFWVLAEEGRLELGDGAARFVQETAGGNLPVWVDARDGKPETVWMGQRLPRFETPEVNLDKLAALFGVGRKQVVEDHPVEVVSTGMRCLHVPLAGLGAFPEIRIHLRGLTELASSLGVDMVQIFTFETEDPEADVHCRVFAPTLGVEEDPVTGSAAGSLGAYLVRHGLIPEDDEGMSRFLLEQGTEIRRPGLVHVEVRRDEGEFAEVRAGGRAVVSLKGSLRIPG